MMNDSHEDVSSVARRIEASFGQDFETWKACFELPCRFAGAMGTFILDTGTREEDLPIFARLRSVGFERTRLDELKVRTLTPGTALLDTVFTRLKSDGTELEKVGALYLCRQTGTGWAAFAVAPHEHNQPALD